MAVSDSTEIARIFINLNGDFELGDGSIGNVATTPELAELTSFLGVLNDAVTPASAFEEAFAKIARKFKRRKGSVLSIRTKSEGKTLVHEFSIVKPASLTYEQTDELLTKAGWSLDCWSPLEISLLEDSSSRASGQAAQIVIDCIQRDL